MRARAKILNTYQAASMENKSYLDSFSVESGFSC